MNFVSVKTKELRMRNASGSRLFMGLKVAAGKGATPHQRARVSPETSTTHNYV